VSRYYFIIERRKKRGSRNVYQLVFSKLYVMRKIAVIEESIMFREKHVFTALGKNQLSYISA
jgi:hypothetical protein